MAVPTRSMLSSRNGEYVAAAWLTRPPPYHSIIAHRTGRSRCVPLDSVRSTRVPDSLPPFIPHGIMIQSRPCRDDISINYQ